MSTEHETDGLPVTGDAVVDDAIRALRDIDPDAPPEHQLPALTAVHEALHQRLTSAVD